MNGCGAACGVIRVVVPDAPGASGNDAPLLGAKEHPDAPVNVRAADDGDVIDDDFSCSGAGAVLARSIIMVGYATS